MKNITKIRPLFNQERGHNYTLPDCLKFITECMGWGEKPDYWDFAAITGDSVAQVYNTNPSTGCDYCVSGYLAGSEYIGYVFDALGYGHEYITAEQLNAAPDKYVCKIVDMIDRDIPILVKTNLNDIPEWHSDVGTYCVIVGYDCGGQVVKLLLDAGKTDTVDCFISGKNKMDLIFIGDKRYEITLEDMYIVAMNKMTHWLTLPQHDGKFFGAAAYRKWADDIDAGRYDDENLPIWENYGVYVCNLATSPGIPFFIFKRLSEMNPIYSHYLTLHDNVKKLFPAFKPDDIVPSDESNDGLWSKLEHLGGGFPNEATIATMKDKEKRAKIATVLRDYAELIDRAVELLDEAMRI